MDRLRNKKDIKDTPSTILVFGGSGVIGRAIATKFGQQGWSVGVHYHQNRTAAEETVAAIQTTEGEARLYQTDINNPSQLKNMFQTFLQDYCSLTLLVWAIGVSPSKLLIKTTSEDWEHVLQTNLTGAFHALRKRDRFLKNNKMVQPFSSDHFQASTE